ncbi:MAG: hypothetical protein GYB64_02455 [Chloroflexi bacterium]|nr:hypothetical protein [Chloroflexota bacterium]
MSPQDDLFETLREWQAPPASEAAKERILATVEEEMTQPGFALRNWLPLQLLVAQVRVVQSEIWLASLFVMALGAWLAISYREGASLVLTLTAPIIAAWGMALLYNEDIEQMMELERATPVPSSLLLLARMTLVFSFNVGVGTAASSVTQAFLPGLGVGELLALWLTPMALLSAGAFFLSVLTRNSVLGGTASMCIWIAYHLFQQDMAVITLDPLWITLAAILAAAALIAIEVRLAWEGI